MTLTPLKPIYTDHVMWSATDPANPTPATPAPGASGRFGPSGRFAYAVDAEDGGSGTGGHGGFTEEGPRDYYRVLKTRLGRPTFCNAAAGAVPRSCTWAEPQDGDRDGRGMGLVKITLKNESALHTSPMEDRDFVYSTAAIAMTAAGACTLAHASASIMVDQLKGEVTARSGALLNNKVSLNFAHDVALGRHADRTPAEVKSAYAYAIVNDVVGDAPL